MSRDRLDMLHSCKTRSGDDLRGWRSTVRSTATRTARTGATRTPVRHRGRGAVPHASAPVRCEPQQRRLAAGHALPARRHGRPLVQAGAAAALAAYHRRARVVGGGPGPYHPERPRPRYSARHLWRRVYKHTKDLLPGLCGATARGRRHSRGGGVYRRAGGGQAARRPHRCPHVAAVSLDRPSHAPCGGRRDVPWAAAAAGSVCGARGAA
jgi:hypothetical protein